MGLVGHIGPAVEQLVAAAPHDDAGMRAQLLDDGAGFLLENLQIGLGADVVVAGKREFDPYHDAHAVAQVIECLLIGARAAPAAEDIHICFHTL